MSEIDLINKNNFTFNKKYGQNFIFDKNLLGAIIKDSGITKDDEVLEIGVGSGTLTKALADRAKKIVGYEIDKSLFDVLSLSLKGYDNISINFKDFLKATTDEVNSQFSGNFKVVANLPYYITTNIIFSLIENNFNVST